MEKTNYPLRCKVDFGSFTREEILKSPDSVACDSMAITSINNEEDGSSSHYFIGFHGNTRKPFEAKDWFAMWAVLTAKIEQSQDLSSDIRSIASSALAKIHLELSRLKDSNT